MEAEYDIIIIGAGAAGLMAALALTEANKKILILEGRERIGGRIHSLDYGNKVLEAGAEFVHGNLPLTMHLLKESNIEFLATRGKMYNSFQGDWTGDDDWGSGWDKLMKRMSELRKDLPLREFLDLNFPENKYPSLRRSVRGFAEGFDLADIADASTMNLYKEWSHEQSKQYRIPKGYGSLMEWIAKQIEKKGATLLLRQFVKKVIWEHDYVRTRTASGGEYSCRKLLITIPISLLQNQTLSAAIHFDPPITNYMKLFEKIGFGKLVKLLFLFREDFWENSHENLGFVFSDQPIPTWWTQLPKRNGLLTGWWGNPLREETISEERIADLAIQSLSGIFSREKEEILNYLEARFIFDWQKDIFSEGAYSYPKPGTTQAIKELKKPIDNSLFFAGEALCEGDSPGTVEAALFSGKEAAKSILLRM